MGKGVNYRIDQGVAVVTLRNPPVNALSHKLRQGLWDAVAQAEADEEARAILIRADGRTFSAGADITEFDSPPQAPMLPALCNRIEAATKPVVAALHGTVLGGGFELALAAHYRVAHPGARVGFPEVTLGLVPGAGGTQRMPRLCGAAAALNLMLTGQQMTAPRAYELGLIDALARTELYAAAIDYALMVAGYDLPLRPTRDAQRGMADPAGYMAAVADKRRLVARAPIDAPRKIVDCVEAALLLPFDMGLELEAAAFADCLRTDQSAALRHVFFAERQAAKPSGQEFAVPREVARVGVVGGGAMGAGIAVALLDAGLSVILVERDTEALIAAENRIAGVYDRALTAGRISTEERAGRIARLRGTLDFAGLAPADLVIEAVGEDAGLKEKVFARLDEVLRAGAILATTTSSLDIDALAATTSRPADVVGLHFYSPAHVMKLVEVIVGRATAPNVVATGFALARKLGKIAVRSGAGAGYIGNRVQGAYRMAADLMVEDGASPYEVDAAMRAYGFQTGPYQALDLAGLGPLWAARQRQAVPRDPDRRDVAILDRLCERGWTGRAAGRGYYRYDTGQEGGAPDPDVLALIAAERAAKGITAQSFGARDIQNRCLAAMVNEGTKLIEEGIAEHPSDIDVVMIHGFGFPRWRGGPLMAADLRGLLAVQNDLKSYLPQAPQFWAPTPLLGVLIRNGHGFEARNHDD